VAGERPILTHYLSGAEDSTSIVMTTGQLASIACLLEVTARKPGNVHRFADFDDTHYLEFLLSASALKDPMDRATVNGVGATVLASVEATRRVVATNTNLGMILLLAPLAAASERADLRSGVAVILSQTTVEDARLVYRAIRLAHPGGLGTAQEQDVASEPTISLVAAMQLAADRDMIARQYAGGYREVFDLVVPVLGSALAAGRPLETAIILAQLSLMAHYPDSLIARKRGSTEADESCRRAAALLTSGWPDGQTAARDLAEFDRWLRTEGHGRNPGTSADLVAAALFVALHDGTIQLPLQASAMNWPARPENLPRDTIQESP
jgi:triphosphoribosyl-dephospho-CoA synthase